MTDQTGESSLNTFHQTSPHTASAAAWSGVLAMTLCVFALVAAEFMPVSLLTPLAVDLQVSEGLVGQGIALSGALAVLTSLSVSTLAGQINRKALLLGMTALMVLSSAVIALAPSYPVYLLGRALIGIAVGGFWSLSAATAIRLVPVGQVPRALAIFNGGNALAMVIVAPLGSYLGTLVGWRGAFFCLLPVSLLALLWQAYSLPSLPASGHHRKGGLFSSLRTPQVLIGLLAVGLFFMGQFALYTYVRPFLESVTRLPDALLSLTLLVIGVAGFVGTLLVGRWLHHGLYLLLTLIPVLMAVIAVLLTVFGSSAGLVVSLLALWGLVATAAPAGWWTWVARTLPDNAEAGGGLMVAVVQLSIALGSTLGGLLFDLHGYRSTFVLSALLLMLSALLCGLCGRLAGRTAAP
ncbi:MFS transporter [Pokkaliibacter sp. MBI-7]|uniref:MFS transporter n=1 Tax=Pokkaliibacter sp. MBI-7 TaxID=3040600 RepID=UPI002447958A|nr:MFS transporter [Pokkaliibacter sp. MBI-7]MDH2433697.1 MFS transporter [Pokkaliibacter sp. MBI-7]